MAYEILWRVHAVLMTTAFLSLVSGVLISLIWKKKKWRYKTHRALGIYAGSAAAAALVTAVILVQISSGYHLSSSHALGGAVTGVLLLSTPILGLKMAKSKNRKILVKVHKVLGYLIIVLMSSAIYFGLEIAGVI